MTSILTPEKLDFDRNMCKWVFSISITNYNIPFQCGHCMSLALYLGIQVKYFWRNFQTLQNLEYWTCFSCLKIQRGIGRKYFSKNFEFASCRLEISWSSMHWRRFCFQRKKTLLKVDLVNQALGTFFASLLCSDNVWTTSKTVLMFYLVGAGDVSSYCIFCFRS